MKKVCSVCKLEKDLSAFAKNYSDKYGVNSICKECANWKHLTPEKREYLTIKNLLFIHGKKQCASCGQIKNVYEFRFVLKNSDGLYAYCNQCLLEKNRERDRRPDVKEKRHERDKTIHAKVNRRKYRDTSQKFKVSQERYNKSQKRLEGNRKRGAREDVKIGCQIRNLIYHALKKQHAEKATGFNEYLGCTVDFFRSYIESLWQEGMTWQNHGRGKDKWHLDHIKPCVAFNLKDEQEQRDCFHYSNMQPLWELDNLRKNSWYNGVLYQFKAS